MASPVWPASKLRWLSKHESSELATASHIFMLKDYVQFRLTGVAVARHQLADSAISSMSRTSDIGTIWWPFLERA